MGLLLNGCAVVLVREFDATSSGAIVGFTRHLALSWGRERITVDFTGCHFLSMGGAVVLANYITASRKHGSKVEIKGCDQANCWSYLERMGFSGLVGLEDKGTFVKHPANGRFSEIRECKNRSQVDQICEEIAACVAPSQADLYDPEQTGLYDTVWYVVSELLSNVVSHSRGIGYVGAQYYGQIGKTVVTVADTGIGILEGFKVCSSSKFSGVTSDEEAVTLALEPLVSSKIGGIHSFGGSEHAGVGLSIVRQLAVSSDGEFALVSGNCAAEKSNVGRLGNEISFPGTTVWFCIDRIAANDHMTQLENVKVALGLDNNGGRSDEFFGSW